MPDFTYAELMQSYYWLNLPQTLGIDSHSLFCALVFKSSLFDFAYTDLSIPNSEIRQLSGLSERALYDARRNLVDFRLRSYSVVISEESRSYPVVKYQKGKKAQSGVYTTYFDVLLAHASQRSVVISEESRSQGVAIPLQSGDITTPVAVIYKKENLSSPLQNDENSWLLNQLMNIAPGWGGPTNPPQREMLSDILEFPHNMIEIVCKETARKGVQGSKMLSWILRGLENFEKFYGNSAPPEKLYRDPHKEKIDALMSIYNDYKDMTRPDDDPIPESSVHTRLGFSLSDVKEHADELDFSIEQYEALIAWWETRA